MCEKHVRRRSLTAMWQDRSAFAFNRTYAADRLGGFCAVCRYRDICRGGCAWMAYSYSTGLLDNPFCFYRQAVTHQRFDLLGEDEPSEAERAYR
jgi:radical SAM protein with 4Fe4S-binding SPASM domain